MTIPIHLRPRIRGDVLCALAVLHYDFASLALDEGIREAVAVLVANGVETFESCEGGPGHAFPEPTIRFEG